MDRSFSKNKLYVKALKNERRFFISSIVNFVSLGCLDNGITKLLKAWCRFSKFLMSCKTISVSATDRLGNKSSVLSITLSK